MNAGTQMGELRDLKAEELDDVSGGWYTAWTSPPPPPVLYPSVNVVEIINPYYGSFSLTWCGALAEHGRTSARRPPDSADRAVLIKFRWAEGHSPWPLCYTRHRLRRWR